MCSLGISSTQVDGRMSLAMFHKTPGFSFAHMKYCCETNTVMCGSLQHKVCSSIGGTVSLFTMHTEAAGEGGGQRTRLLARDDWWSVTFSETIERSLITRLWGLYRKSWFMYTPVYCIPGKCWGHAGSWRVWWVCLLPSQPAVLPSLSWLSTTPMPTKWFR